MWLKQLIEVLRTCQKLVENKRMVPMVRMKLEKSPCLKFCRISLLRLSIGSERVEFHKEKAWEHRITARSNVVFAQCAKTRDYVELIMFRLVRDSQESQVTSFKNRQEIRQQ